MLLRDHEAFRRPERNCALWRYIDFTKLVDLLDSRCLTFPRADQFEDPYEGTWSAEGIRQLRDPQQNGGLPQKAVEQLVAFMTELPKQMFVSCWHMSEHESAAMWRLYLHGNEGVAIKSDWETLSAVLDRATWSIGVSVVQYVDYDRTVIPFRNLFYPFVHKRQSFEHEKEVRAVIWAQGSANKPNVTGDTTLLQVAVDVEQLVKSVVVAPAAPPWFGSLVERVIRRYGLETPIERSSLFERPVF